MRKLIAILAVVSLLAAIAAVTALGSTPSVSWHVGTSKTVSIHRGGLVKWVFAGDAAHNVHGRGFTSPTRSRRGYTYSHRFNTRGRFTVTCLVHPGQMKTIVRVS